MRGARRGRRAISEPSLSRRRGTKPSGNRAQGTEAVGAETSLLALSARATQTRGSDGVGTPRADVGHWQPAGHPGKGRAGNETDGVGAPTEVCPPGKGQVGVGAWEDCTPGEHTVDGAVARAPAGQAVAGRTALVSAAWGRATRDKLGVNRPSASLGARVPLAPFGSRWG